MATDTPPSDYPETPYEILHEAVGEMPEGTGARTLIEESLTRLAEIQHWVRDGWLSEEQGHLFAKAHDPYALAEFTPEQFNELLAISDVLTRIQVGREFSDGPE